MRLLFTIPHFYKRLPKTPSAHRHGSSGSARDRLYALTACLSAPHQLYGAAQCMMHLAHHRTGAANQGTTAEVHLVVCTTRGQHLLDDLSLDPRLFQHCPTDAEPELLGFQCREILRGRLDDYDYYCYLEDDLIVHDPWLFVKLAWFNGHVGQDKLLLPNRFERAQGPLVHKAYVDGDLARRVTAPFQNVDDCPWLESEVMGAKIVFRRPLNPHSGCYFLNARQMHHWSEQPHFLDRGASFIGPLESAATLGIMRAFKIYKPAPENANFLEIEHCGSRFVSLIREPDQRES